MIVCDTHHGGGNLVVDQLPVDPRITYHGRSVGDEDGRLRWMPGLDASVDCFMLPGHHAMEGTPGAFLPHTAWSKELADFRINGRSVGEIGLESCFAGHWDVPFALVQGDAAQRGGTGAVPGCRDGRGQARDRARPVRWVGPAAARQLTAQKIAEAIELTRAGKIAPFKPSCP